MSSHERHIRNDGPLEHKGPTLELRRRLPRGHLGSDTRRRVEGRDAGTAGAQTFSQGALRDELDIERAVEVLLSEQLVLPDVRSQNSRHLTIFEKQSQAFAVHTHVVRDDGEIRDPRVSQGTNEAGRVAAQSEASHGDGHPVAHDVCQRGGRVSPQLGCHNRLSLTPRRVPGARDSSESRPAFP